MVHPKKASQRWRDANKEKIADFNKKKAEEKKEKEKKEKEKKEKEKKEKEKKEKACCAMSRSTKDTGFFFDTAASLHYTYSKTWYIDEPTMLDDPIEVETCDGGTVYAAHIGLIKLDVLTTDDEGHDEEVSLTIKDVYFCLEMNTNLLSSGTFVRTGLSFGASKKRLQVTDDEPLISYTHGSHSNRSSCFLSFSAAPIENCGIWSLR